ncbi:TPA: hypothetical protein I7730_01365 [Vibrio vulnificus]|uniref:Uncharacterized protein n=1 Tax=Vibrio vulnificus TaxID=672 RepID=A0A8H9K5F9_VIBVL|nr:hypothetical protein [Vibrio vulnificus]HAS8538445.1 hypothetical protein [Vibrio vulnificus]
MNDVFKANRAHSVNLPVVIMLNWVIVAILGIFVVFSNSQFGSGLGVYDLILTLSFSLMLALTNRFRQEQFSLLAGLTLFTALFGVLTTVKFGYNNSASGLLYVHTAMILGAVYFGFICVLALGRQRLITRKWNELLEKGGLLTPFMVVNYLVAPIVYLRQVSSGFAFDYSPLVMSIHICAVGVGLCSVLSLMNKGVHSFFFNGRFDVLHALLIIAPYNVILFSSKAAGFDISTMHWVDVSYLVVTLLLFVLGAVRFLTSVR